MSSLSLGVSAEENCVTDEKLSDDFGVSAENSLWRASLLIIDRCSRNRSVSGFEAQSCRSLVTEVGACPSPCSVSLSPGGWLKGSLWDRSPSTGSWGVCLCQFSFSVSSTTSSALAFPEHPGLCYVSWSLGGCGHANKVNNRPAREEPSESCQSWLLWCFLQAASTALLP